MRGVPHLENFPIGAATQPLQQVIVVPGVPVKDVRVYEVHSWGPELGLRPGASRASGLRMLAPPSLPTRPAPALPPPAVGSPLPTLASCPSTELCSRRLHPLSPEPWQPVRGSLPWDPGDPPPPPPGPWAACKPDANYLHCDLEGALTLPRSGQRLKTTLEPLLSAECWATTWRWQVYTGMTMQRTLLFTHTGTHTGTWR